MMNRSQLSPEARTRNLVAGVTLESHQVQVLVDIARKLNVDRGPALDELLRRGMIRPVRFPPYYVPTPKGDAFLIHQGYARR